MYIYRKNIKKVNIFSAIILRIAIQYHFSVKVEMILGHLWKIMILARSKSNKIAMQWLVTFSIFSIKFGCHFCK